MSKRGESIWKRKDGRWEGRYIKSRTPEGKALYASVYAKTYTEVKEKKNSAISNNLSNHARCAQSNEFYFINDVTQSFLNFNKNLIKRSSLYRYYEITNNYIIPKIGNIKIISYHQASDFMLTPNNAYEKLMGVKTGTLCPKRDVVEELYEELSKYGIDLYLYFCGHGPCLERNYDKMGFYVTGTMVDRHRKLITPKYEVEIDPHEALPKEIAGIPLGFVEQWAKVLEEYSNRYNNKICGWWIDSCYDWMGFRREHLKLLYDVAKSGNKNALVGCNNGDIKPNGIKKDLYKWYDKDEITSGEMEQYDYIPKGRFTDGAQNHMLLHLGKTWGGKEACRDNEYMRDYVKKVNEIGAVITVDINVSHNGDFPKVQKDALSLSDI